MSTIPGRGRSGRRGCVNVERVCFLGRVRPERLAEYRARHEQVWPDMLAALREAGWGNYSLFLTGDGLLVGYLETQDYQAALDRMAATEVNARWQRDMAPYFTELDGLPPDQGFKRVDEIFHVD
jgi:L-rhamnose mutarotase